MFSNENKTLYLIQIVSEGVLYFVEKENYSLNVLISRFVFKPSTPEPL